MEEDDELDYDVPQTPSWPSWTTFCRDPDQEEDWPEELEGYEEEDWPEELEGYEEEDF